MHSFDKDKINGNITVRNAAKGEKLTTLDEDNHELSTEDIVIADQDQPIALAGVMGALTPKLITIPKTSSLNLRFLIHSIFERPLNGMYCTQKRHNDLNGELIQMVWRMPQ